VDRATQNTTVAITQEKREDMKISELQAAIERRGYVVGKPVAYPTPENYTMLYIHRGDAHSAYAVTHSEITDARMSIGDYADAILRRMAQDQFHVQCSQCHEPLLQKEVFVPGPALGYGVPLEQINRHHMEQRYRSAKAGPDSPVLSHCPKCGVPLLADTVSDIAD
jgi:hypothetical protein